VIRGVMRGVMRVVAVTPSALLQAGLASLAQVVGSASNIDEGMALAAEVRPDLMIVECDEHSIQDVIAAAGESAPMLLLSADLAPTWIAEALRAGVRGVIPRDAGEAEIAAAMEAAVSGLVVLHPEWLEGALSRRVRAAGPAEPLSPREIEVLRLMAEGASNKTIAWKLQISEHTVKFHVNSIFSKLGAGTRTEAVMLGLRRGLIPL
jgi:two-component system, NarL family, response regulator YdfI